MKKGLTLLVILLVLLIVIYLLPDRGFKTQIVSKKIFPVKEDKVNYVKIKWDKDVYIYKKEDGKWKIYLPLSGEADSVSVKSFVEKVVKIELEEPVTLKKEKYGKFQLTGEAKYVEIGWDDKKKKKILIGKRSSDYNFYFVRVDGIEGIYRVEDAVFSRRPNSWDPWKNKEILSFKNKDEIKHLVIEGFGSKKDFLFKEKEKEWTVNGKKADKVQVDNLLAKLVKFRTDTFPPKNYKPSGEKATITIEDKSGKKYNLEVYQDKASKDYIIVYNNNYYKLYQYRLQDFFKDIYHYLAKEELVNMLKAKNIPPLEEIFKEVDKDVTLEVETPSSNGELKKDVIEYAVKGISLDSNSGNRVIFYLDGKKKFIEKGGLPIKLDNLKSGKHYLIGAVLTPYDAVYRKSIVEVPFYVKDQKKIVAKVPKNFLKIVSPLEEVVPSGNKILVDYILKTSEKSEDIKLAYYLNNSKVELKTRKPFTIEKLPAGRVTLKLELQDKKGKVLASDSKTFVVK